MIGLIGAYAQGRVMGNQGKMPWMIPGEQTMFRQLTTGNYVIMGRRTFEEIGHPLPNRETIVVSQTKSFDMPHCITVPSLQQAILAVPSDCDGYIAGGRRIFEEGFQVAQVLYITEILKDFQGDVYFPEFDQSLFRKECIKIVTRPIPYRTFVYHRLGEFS